MNKILEVVIKRVEENCSKLIYRRGAQIKKIQKNRRILMRKKKKFRKKLESKDISPSWKSVIKKLIGEIDKKLLSHEKEKIDREMCNRKNKIQSKTFLRIWKKKKQTWSKIGTFRLNGEIFNILDDICKKMS